jgi:hypothetical protein
VATVYLLGFVWYIYRGGVTMNEFDVELEYEYRWERYRQARGDWSCAVFLRSSTAQLSFHHRNPGLRALHLHGGRMLKKPPFPTTFTNWK